MSSHTQVSVSLQFKNIQNKYGFAGITQGYMGSKYAGKNGQVNVFNFQKQQWKNIQLNKLI